MTSMEVGYLYSGKEVTVGLMTRLRAKGDQGSSIFIGMFGNISCKDGLNKGQKWSGPNRSRNY